MRHSADHPLSSVLVHEPLRISLADIRSADTRGKWWLVGAAWGGDPLAERAQEKQNKQHKAPAKNSQDDDLGMLGANDVEALVKLARKQGMNTDVRRSVFVIMMSSEVSCDRSLVSLQDC
jgi:nucleolar MIF4G domain-containing protein 1